MRARGVGLALLALGHAAPASAQPAPAHAEAAPASHSPVDAPRDEGFWSWLDRRRALDWIGPVDAAISAYVQAQYESHDDSEDQLDQSGAPLNQDRFLVRRGRLRLDAASRFTELVLELDGNTTRGTSVNVRRAEATVLYRGAAGWDGKAARHAPYDEHVPLAALTFGLLDIPFGFEIGAGNRERLFMERSLASLAFFPADPDVGARLAGGAAFFRYSLAVTNGEPLDDRPGGFGGRDPNAGKEVIARLGAVARPLDALLVRGGVSVLRGEGLHPGTPATKGSAQWRDLNENASIDTGEVTAAPGSAATPSESYDRWSFGLDAGAVLDTPIGQTHLYGEVAVAQNLDRGLFVADPVKTGIDLRELGYYVAITQELSPFAAVGFRLDRYDPNGDFLSSRQGRPLPSSQVITTYSPVVAIVLPSLARLAFQYDVIDDRLGRDGRGVPADLANDRWTLRLQVQR